MQYKILHVVSTLGYGGVSKFILNYYNNIEHSKVKFDFISHGIQEDFHEDFLKTGSKIFYTKTIKESSVFSYIKKGIKIIRENGPYHAIHIHTDYQAGIYAYIARLAGIKIRICHSHRIDAPNKIGDKLLPFFKLLISKNATHLVASSKKAGTFLFGDKDFKVLNNAIDLDDYSPISVEEICELKRSLGIENEWNGIIIGHVGTFTDVKNQFFFIPLMEELKKRNIDFKIIFVGEGLQKDKFKNQVHLGGHTENVVFTGIRSDVPKLMQLLDVFVLPSKYEGLGIVTIEAQSCNIPCVVSDTVPIETDMGLNLIQYLSLQKHVSKWVNAILNVITDNKEKNFNVIKKKITENGYNIKVESKKLLDLYRIF